jgi:hypothetical protein
MSQIAMIASPGSVKPDIETLTGDTGGAVGPSAALNLNLLTGSGLTSTGVAGTNTITFSLDNHVEATGQTVGAVTADLISIDLGATPRSVIIEAKVVGYESTTPLGIGYNLICAARTSGAAATIVAAQDKIVFEEGALLAGDCDLVAVGNTIVVRALGTAALTVNWKATTDLLGV